MRKVNESKAWTGLSQAYAAHFGDPDSIWRIDNKHGTGMADVFMCRPIPSWVELKSGYIEDHTLCLYHPLSKPQYSFLLEVAAPCGSGVLTLLDSEQWIWLPTKTLPPHAVGAKKIDLSGGVGAIEFCGQSDLRDEFFFRLAQSLRGR